MGAKRVVPWTVVAAGLALALHPEPAPAQFDLRTVLLLGDASDPHTFGRIAELRVDSAGRIWVRSDGPPEGAGWRTRIFDERGRPADAADVPVFDPPDRRVPPGAPTWSGGMPPDSLPDVPDTVPPHRGASEGVSWIVVDDSVRALVRDEPPAVGFYVRRGSGFVRTGAVELPRRREATPRAVELGLAEPTAEAPGVRRALSDGARLWVLLGWSGAREEWAVLDPDRAAIDEMLVLPAAYSLRVVRGRRLYGIQGAEGRHMVHVLRRGG